MVYLSSTNGGDGSGATNFYLDRSREYRDVPTLSITPKRGTALLFLHNVRHEGAPVLGDAIKYAMRSDGLDFVCEYVLPDHFFSSVSYVRSNVSPKVTVGVNQ